MNLSIIINPKTKFQKITREFVLALIGLILVYLLGFPLIQKLLPSEEILTCGMEEIVSKGGAIYFKDKPHNFPNGERQDSSKSHSGRFSIKFLASDKYGLEYRIDSLEGGESLNIVVWRYRMDHSAAPPEIVATTGKDFWKGTNLPREVESSGWERLRLECVVPDSVKGQDLKIYLWNPGNSVVYFDDMEITIRRRGWFNF